MGLNVLKKRASVLYVSQSLLSPYPQPYLKQLG